MSHEANVRVRIAPSPTGYPHVGTAYIALMNLAFAKRHQGKFILRIEDTDQTRSRPIYEENIYKALKWAGLEWDEGPDKGGPYGPYRQSERTAIYQEYAQKLLDRKMAYKCFATPQELEQMRLTSKSGYNRLYRNLTDEEIEQRIARGEKYTVRLKVPLTGELHYEDGIMGKIMVRYEEIDDQILLKADGFPTYHLANVVDDHLMKITHVLRGSEWLTSTPKHIVLYEAFGWTPPKFYHLPLLLGADGKKLSKRKNPCSIFYFKDSGYIPEAFLNFLSLMGYSMPNDEEIYSLDHFCETFDISRIGSSGAFFDFQKLDWINQQYLMRTTDPKELWSKISSWAFDEKKMLQLMEMGRTRIRTYSEFFDLFHFFFTNHLELTLENLVPKSLTQEGAAMLLQATLWRLDEKESWSKDSIESVCKEFVELFGVNLKKEIMPVLYSALTGKTQGPPLYASFELLGIDRCRARILQAISFLGGLSSKKVELLQSSIKKKDCLHLLKKAVANPS
jgi:glutamyl-tRNA synthetase